MSDENLRRLLGDDYDQMSPDELKDRLGKRTPDFNPTKVISPASNENYKKAVDNNAGEYYNSRVDDLYKAYLKDRYPNTTPQDIANRMSQKAGITPPQINHILPDKNGNITMPDGAVHKAYGAYDDGDNTINLRSNGKFNKNDEMSTVAHEMRHAINFKGNSDPI